MTTLTDLALCCPRCVTQLEEDGIGEQVLRCGACGRTYPVIAGIPDLRIFRDPYLGVAADRAKGLRLAERAGDMDFAGLLEYYYSITDVVPPLDARRYVRGLLGASARSAAALDAWESRAETSGAARDAFLEIGCGTAPLLVAAATRYRMVVGVDIALRWLIVAQKRLEEARVCAPLVCACAEALPFTNESFGTAAAESALETVRSQRRALREVTRVLVPGGYFFIATPNALSLGPDPHVRIWAAGYLPQRWINMRVAKRGGVPPKRHLLSVFALRARVRESGLELEQLFLPEVPPGQRAHFSLPMRLAIRLYSWLRAIPGTRQVLFLIGPLFYAVARNSGIAEHGSGNRQSL